MTRPTCRRCGGKLNPEWSEESRRYACRCNNIRRRHNAGVESSVSDEEVERFIANLPGDFVAHLDRTADDMAKRAT